MQLILRDAATAVFVEVVEALLEVGVVLQLHLIIVFSGAIFNERYVDVILKLFQIKNIIIIIIKILPNVIEHVLNNLVLFLAERAHGCNCLEWA